MTKPFLDIDVDREVALMVKGWSSSVRPSPEDLLALGLYPPGAEAPVPLPDLQGLSRAELEALLLERQRAEKANALAEDMALVRADDEETAMRKALEEAEPILKELQEVHDKLAEELQEIK